MSILVALDAQYPEKRQLEHVPSVGPALLPLMHFDVDRHHTQNVPSAQLAHDVYGLHTSSYSQQTKALKQSCKAPCKDTIRKARMKNGGSSDAIALVHNICALRCSCASHKHQNMIKNEEASIS